MVHRRLQTCVLSTNLITLAIRVWAFWRKADTLCRRGEHTLNWDISEFLIQCLHLTAVLLVNSFISLCLIYKPTKNG